MSEDPELLDWAEAAQVLGVSEHWLKKRVAARTIPCTRLSPRRIRFSRQNLLDIQRLHQQQVGAAAVPSPPLPRGMIPRKPRASSRR